MSRLDSVILVDTHDTPVGCTEKLHAHQAGLLHRAFSIMIYRENARKIELLLHKRAENKYHSGGLWTNSCCSHPRPHETTLIAAERRLREEMGMQAEELEEIGHFIYQAQLDNDLTEHEFDHVLIGTSADSSPNPSPEEVAETRWVEITTLRKELTAHPEQFTAWFEPVLACVEKHLAKSAP